MISRATLLLKSFVRLMIRCVLLIFISGAWAQPALISVVPPNRATGIATNASVVFTFNTSMDAGVSSATFYYYNSTVVPVSSVWSAGNTVLTCTPISGFPPETNIMWSVVGLSSHNELITPTPTGKFTTAASGVVLSLANPAFAAGNFSFVVRAASNQTVVVEYKTNLTSATWQPLLTTNSPPGDQFSVSAPGGSNRSMFFRARTGP